MSWYSSKHHKDPFTGDCKIVSDSSLRKLARAIQRGKVPEERMFIIETAKEKAQRRQKKYLNKPAKLRL
jgi:hypothetical protein